MGILLHQLSSNESSGTESCDSNGSAAAILSYAVPCSVNRLALCALAEKAERRTRGRMGQDDPRVPGYDKPRYRALWI